MPDRSGEEAFVSQDSVPICAKDGFPKVRIAGRCIGGQRIVDLVKCGETVYWVFESGHQLPMLCFCCGKPLVYSALEGSR
jgi:hypothetical protein